MTFGITDGTIQVTRVVVTFIGIIAAVTDLLRGKIYNLLTFPAAFLGLVFCLYSMGLPGLLHSVSGTLAGLILFGWMFWLRHIGGGDVKLLMAFGSWGGGAFAVEVAILSILLGGVFSLVSLIWKGRLGAFIVKLKVLVYSLIIREMEVEVPEIDRTLTIPFGVPIAVAAIWTVNFHPLYGWLPWT